MMRLSDVVIVGMGRTPRGRFGGTLRDMDAIEMSVAILPEVLRRAGVRPEQVDLLIWGQTRQAGCGGNPARPVAYRSGIPEHVPAYTVNMTCISSMQAAILGAQAIVLGQAEVVVAGGMENMSNIPYLLKGARWGFRSGDQILHDGAENTCRCCGLTMIQVAERIAEEFEIPREPQDLLALESHRKAARAQDEGWFDEEIVPIEVPQPRGGTLLFSKDETIRRDTSLEKLSRLPPLVKPDGTVTAGNSCPLTDGANGMVIASRRAADRLGLRPLASFVSYHVVGVDPALFGIGPAKAVPVALERAGLRLSDIDLIELNEAFASVVLANQKLLGFDMSRLNVHGGALALGHPTGDTGTRMMITLINALRRRGGRYGLATLCGGGGWGGAVVLKAEEG